jgi:hypothetical protein
MMVFSRIAKFSIVTRNNSKNRSKSQDLREAVSPLRVPNDFGGGRE